MSRETLYTCDRCKKKAPRELQSFDFGKDYTAGRSNNGDIPRVIVDLCSQCWIELKRFLQGTKTVGEII